jgi:hypothetical protein
VTQVKFDLRAHGIETLGAACKRKKWAHPTAQKWVAAGLLPAVKVGPGRGVLLVRVADVDAFERPPMGRPVGAKDARPRGRATRRPRA